MLVFITIVRHNAEKYGTIYSNVRTEIHVRSLYAFYTQGTVFVVGMMYKTGRINIILFKKYIIFSDNLMSVKDFSACKALLS